MGICCNSWITATYNMLCDFSRTRNIYTSFFLEKNVPHILALFHFSYYFISAFKPAYTYCFYFFKTPYLFLLHVLLQTYSNSRISTSFETKKRLQNCNLLFPHLLCSLFALFFFYKHWSLRICFLICPLFHLLSFSSSSFETHIFKQLFFIFCLERWLCVIILFFLFDFRSHCDVLHLDTQSKI